MCGPNLPRPSLGGALAVLAAPSSSGGRLAAPALRGNLVFHSPQPGAPSTVATHATFTPSPRPAATVSGPGDEEEALGMSEYVVGIHASGDLQKPAFESPVLHQFGFREGSSRGAAVAAATSSHTLAETKIRLTTPLEIGVGGAGIIGRRVTVWRRRDSDSDSATSSSSSESGSNVFRGFPVAEGIVGFN